jgi:hypothetical protein
LIWIEIVDQNYSNLGNFNEPNFEFYLEMCSSEVYLNCFFYNRNKIEKALTVNDNSMINVDNFLICSEKGVSQSSVRNYIAAWNKNRCKV